MESTRDSRQTFQTPSQPLAQQLPLQRLSTPTSTNLGANNIVRSSPLASVRRDHSDINPLDVAAAFQSPPVPPPSVYPPFPSPSAPPPYPQQSPLPISPVTTPFQGSNSLQKSAKSTYESPANAPFQQRLLTAAEQLEIDVSTFLSSCR